MDASKNILVTGAGKIGCILAVGLARLNNTQVTLADIHTSNIPSFLQAQKHIQICQCDVENAAELFELIQQHRIHAIVSCLPFFRNFSVAEIAKSSHCHYFDLTEDAKVTRDIFALAKNANTAFVPQCGIAPGFINVLAAHYIQQCDTVDSVKLYCGALPQKSIYPMGYALTWSTEGLINEYANLCTILKKGKSSNVQALSGLEKLILNNEAYEAFYTSGAIGTLADTYENQINSLFYKTIRYPGHCKKMRFLMKELKLENDRDLLKKLLENALPTTKNDFVILHVAIRGTKNQKTIEHTDTRRFYPDKIGTIECNAIQMVTSIAAIATINTVLTHPDRYHGAIRQEDFDLKAIMDNPMANYLKGR